MQHTSAVHVACVVLCALSLGLSGCGGENAASSSTASVSSGQQSAGATSPQAAVVQKFIQAVQSGDRATAKSLLTAKTVAKIDSEDVDFLPSALEEGSFRIGKTVKSGSNYFIQCVYSVTEPNGQTTSQHLQWMVKREESANWEIFGMVVHTPNNEPMVVNFEKDLLVSDEETSPQQAMQAGSEEARQNPPQQAAAPQDPFQTPRR